MEADTIWLLVLFMSTMSWPHSRYVPGYVLGYNAARGQSDTAPGLEEVRRP